MTSENIKTLFLAAWVVAVCLAAIAIEVASVRNWIVVACVATVPPLVGRYFWRAPDRTTSESIQDALR